MVKASLDDVHFFVIHPHHDIHRAETGAEMSRPGAFHFDERVGAAHIRNDLKFLVFVSRRIAHALEFFHGDQF